MVSGPIYTMFIFIYSKFSMFIMQNMSSIMIFVKLSIRKKVRFSYLALNIWKSVRELYRVVYDRTKDAFTACLDQKATFRGSTVEAREKAVCYLIPTPQRTVAWGMVRPWGDRGACYFCLPTTDHLASVKSDGGRSQHLPPISWPLQFFGKYT